MARTINIFTLIVIAIWTLLSLGAWAIFSLGGDFVHGQLDWMFRGDPEIVPVASGVFRFFQNLGLGLVLFIWALGTFMVWFAGMVMRKLVQSMTVVSTREYGWAEPDRDDRPMKDITPPRPSRALPRE